MPRDELRPRAARVDVLDAQQEAAAAGARPLVADERGQRVAQVQLAVGARREAEDGRVMVGEWSWLQWSVVANREKVSR